MSGCRIQGWEKVITNQVLAWATGKGEEGRGTHVCLPTQTTNHKGMAGPAQEIRREWQGGGEMGKGVFNLWGGKGNKK